MVNSQRGPYAKTAGRRAAILDAARDSFLELGYEAATVRDIARRVGMSHTGVLHHFTGKEELLLGLLVRRDAAEARRAGIDAGDDSTVDAEVDAGVDAEPEASARTCPAGSGARPRGGLAKLLREHQRTPQLMRWWAELSAAAARPDHPAHTYFARRYARRRQVYAERLSAGRMGGPLDPRIEPAVAAMLFAAVLDGLQAQWLFDPNLDTESAINQFQRLLSGDR